MRKLLAVVVFGIMQSGASYAGQSAIATLKTQVSPSAMDNFTTVTRISAPVEITTDGKIPGTAGDTIKMQSALDVREIPATGALKSMPESAAPEAAPAKEQGTFSLSSFHNRNFGPDDISVAGWHVEADDDFLVLSAILNPRFSREWYRKHHWSRPYLNIIFKCAGKDCVSVDSFTQESAPDRREHIRLMDDGNFVYININGMAYKNFRAETIVP